MKTIALLITCAALSSGATLYQHIGLGGARLRATAKLAVITLVALLCGCATGVPPSIAYFSHSGETFAPKANNYDPPVFDSPPQRNFKVIGHVVFSSDSLDKVLKELKKLARQHGADAIEMGHTQQSNNAVPYSVPPSIEYQPVTTTTSGTVNAISPYGYPGTAVYSGMQTSSVPVVNPGYSGVANISLISGTAFLVVYTTGGWRR